MALPGHSPPPPFTGPGSPNRMMNGHLDTQLPPMYGPPTRSMLPPSPQNFRFPNPNPNPPPISAPSPSLPSLNDNRNVTPFKRPGSSMSISSMLGGEPEKPVQEIYLNHNSRGPSRQGSLSGPVPNPFPTMSPPQSASKPGLGEYSYKPRSQTPDRIGFSYANVGARQRSSSSGTPLQRPAPFVEPHNRSTSTIPAPRFLEQSPNIGYSGGRISKNEQDERARRTSLSGILQRPNSQPQAGQFANPQQDTFGHSMVPAPLPERQTRIEGHIADPFQRNGVNTSYDIKPPGLLGVGRPAGPQTSPTRGISMPTSPDLQRTSAGGSQGHKLANILNGPPSQPTELTSVAAQRMARQDSTQSQSERSPFGDRGKFRQYSPFASSFSAQGANNSGIFADEQGRKGSDELSQHRALLGLAAESKRGRYSPMPQVVQGAQAQTPVPDAGVKTEHGRVFSGIGGGIGTTPTPVGASLKRDGGRTPLNEDNLMKISRSASGLSKRSRKLQDDDTGGDADGVNGSRVLNGRANKKGKYQHSYKVDLEDASNNGVLRRNTPLTGLNSIRNMSGPPNSTLSGANHSYQPHNQRNLDNAPVLKPKKMIKVSSVFNIASRAPRRHLGNFTYRPEIAPSDLRKSSSQKFDISIKPNLVPSFSAVEHVNCTYTIHVPRMWLQERERALICAEQYLWGSGIYTDDSDPIAAAIHAGFLKASFGDSVDTNLLSKVIQEQNPKIEWPKSIKVPSQPMDIERGKDLNITLVVLPLLERYEGSARFGIKSRAWPEGFERTQHDGVSFGVLNIEFVNIGTEEMRMGRTGASRRERIRRDLEARQRGFQIQKDRIARTKQKRLEQLKSKRVTGTNFTAKLAPTSAPTSMTNGTGASMTQQVVPATA